MESPKATISSTAIRFGLIGTLISIIIGMVFYFVGMQTSSIGQWVGFFILLAIIVLAVKSFKDAQEDGLMSFGQGFKVGFMTCLIMGVFSIIWTYIYVSFIDPGLPEMILDKQIMQMEERGMSDEQIDQAMSFTEPFITPIAMSIMAFVWTVIAGTIASLVIAAIMQKK